MSKGVFFRRVGTQQLHRKHSSSAFSLDKNITVQESTYTIIRQQGFNSVLFPYQHQRTADIINISPRGIPSTHKTAFNSRRHIIEVQFSNSPSHWYIHQPSSLRNSSRSMTRSTGLITAVTPSGYVLIKHLLAGHRFNATVLSSSARLSAARDSSQLPIIKTFDTKNKRASLSV